MNAHFTRLFTYNDWANKLVLDSLASIDPWPDRTSERLSHILVAQNLWYARVTASDQPTDLFPAYTLEELRVLNDRSTAQWLGLTSEILPDDRWKTVTYRNTAGQPHESILIDIMTQVINHATHHRGQVIAALRDAGHEPPKTDFIFFAREPATVG